MTFTENLERQIQESMAVSLAEHQIEERMRQGVWREWRCCKPGTWFHGFDITTRPGYLIVTGDLGCLVVCREYDMLPWCRMAVHSTEYFASKVEACTEPVEEFRVDMFREWAEEWLADPEHADDDSAEAAAAIDAVTSALHACDDLCEAELYRLTEDAWSGNDPPRWRTHSSRFLYLREAVRWFVGHHSEPGIPDPNNR